MLHRRCTVEYELMHCGRPSFLKLVMLFCVAYAALQTTYGAFRQFSTYDEIWHLEWNRRLLERGIFERESNTHFKSPTPVLLPNVVFLKASKRLLDFGNSYDVFAERLPNVVWLLLLVAGVFRLGRRVGGPEAACLSVIAAALDPNLMAHGSLLTVDLAYAAASVWCLYAILRFIERPSPPTMALLGVWFGIALTAKFSAVLFAFLLPVVPLVFPRNRTVRLGDMYASALYLAGAMAVAALVVCAAYLFEGLGHPLGSMTFYSSFFLALKQVFPRLILPLPEPFITGIDHCLAAERSRTWNVVLLDRTYQAGVWFYFIVVGLFKTPLPVLLASAWGFVRLGLTPQRTSRADFRITAGALLIFGGYFSFIFQTQVGYRYVLFCLPLLYVLAACGYRGAVWNGRAKAFLAGAVMFIIAGQAPFSGNLLAYTNLLVPKDTAYLYLADSNLDWGQNRDKITGLIESAGLSSPLIDPIHVLPGINIFSTNQLAGVWWNYRQHRWVRRHLKPFLQLAYTYFVFSVSTQQFENFMASERTLRREPLALLKCAAAAQYSAIEDGASVSPEVSGALCIRTEQPATISFSAPAGDIELGRRTMGGWCRTEYFSTGAQAWYALEPGDYEFCGRLNAPVALQVKKGKAQYAVAN